jgi:hypothetical protein
MNASDWPSGDRAMAERKGRALGTSSVRAIWLAGETSMSTRATARGGSCRARRHAPSAERAAAATTTSAEATVRRQCHVSWSIARIFNRDAQASGIGPPAPRLLVQAMPQQRPDLWQCGRRQQAEAGFVPNDQGQCGGRTVSPEWDPAGEHFVQDAPQCPDVGGPRHRMSLRLLRRHVGGSANDSASIYLVSGRRVADRGKAEVEYLDGAVFADLDVAGLEIAMNDSSLMSGVQRLGNLLRNR